MDISNIHFHDTRILRIVEETAQGTLTMEVDYPTDWDANIFERRWLVFDDVLGYRVCEGPFEGPPTILDVQIIDQVARRCSLQIDTNAGTRHLSCIEVHLLDQAPESANQTRDRTGFPL